MSTSVNGINANDVYSTINLTNIKASDSNKTEEKKETKATEKKEAVTYEKTDNGMKKNATYSVNKMSKEDRDAIVEQLKTEQEAREKSFLETVQKTLNQQVNAFGEADGIWKFLATGKFEVDEETKKKAQEDISEDGYYGVKKTSERLFKFASALAGDDTEKMKEMQKAVEKGYKQAEKTWGGELPEISKKTLEATNKLFEDYYASKNVISDEE